MKGAVAVSMDIIKEALSKGDNTLNEYDAKRFLSGSGIPVCHEAMAHDADSAAKEAARIGFPVVLKAAGKDLFHKTEIQGIALNLKSEAEVTQEAERLLRIPGSEAVLVQESPGGGIEDIETASVVAQEKAIAQEQGGRPEVGSGIKGP